MTPPDTMRKVHGQGDELMKLILLGATGVVGQAVLRCAIADERISRICAPTRRPLDANPKLENPILDFSQPLPEEDWWRAEAMICCLGTTIGAAGSKKRFYEVDHDLILACSAKARQAGTPCLVLNSSLGADPGSKNFYLRTKGQTEVDLREAGFDRLVLVRPSLIDADREEQRLGEQAGRLAGRLLRPVIPPRYRPVTAEKIAASLLSHIAGDRGVTVVESETI